MEKDKENVVVAIPIEELLGDMVCIFVVDVFMK